MTTPWMTRKAVAEYLGVSQRTIDQWAIEGKLRAPRKISGGALRYHRDEVDEDIASAPRSERRSGETSVAKG